MSIDPVAFTLFGFPVYWYGIVYFLGFLFGYWFLLNYGGKHFKKKFLEDTFFYMILFSLLGARLFHVFLYEPSFYLQNLGQIIRVDQGGMSIHGGLLFGLITLWYQSKKHNVNVLRLLDIISIPLIVSLSFGRIANFVNQELIGKITTSSLGVVFERIDNNLRHPVQLYESVAYMVHFQLLFYLYVFHKFKAGTIFSLFVLLYNGTRFVLEFFKDSPEIFFFFSLEQILCLVFFSFGVYVLYKIRTEKDFSLYSKARKQ